MNSFTNWLSLLLLLIAIPRGLTVEPSSQPLSSPKASAINLLFENLASSSSSSNDDNDQDDKECQETVEKFTEALSGFDACALMHTIPYKICLSCSIFYQNLADNYQMLQETWRNKSCPKSSEETFENLFTESQNIWDRGNCQGKDETKID